MFFGKALLTRVFLYAGRAILRFTACVNKKAGERRREIHFTLKIHDFWKLQSRDIHSQMKPLILYNCDLWNVTPWYTQSDETSYSLQSWFLEATVPWYNQSDETSYSLHSWFLETTVSGYKQSDKTSYSLQSWFLEAIVSWYTQSDEASYSL